jgi:hypothetical protein
MSTVNFNKEVVRFTYHFKQDCLLEILDKVPEDKESAYYKYIKEQLDIVKDELQHFDKRYKANNARKQTKDKIRSAPRPMSAYNKFIKKTLPEIAKNYATMDNKSRMAKASEIWKKLTDKEKQDYKNLEF